MNAGVDRSDPPQELRFCRAPDGVRIAYAVHGSGPPLLLASCWLSHLQHDWQSPVWRHFLETLGEIATVIRYDERGYGLSDWDVDDFTLDARVGDLEAVVEAAGLDRFAMLGMAQGGPVAIRFVRRHPGVITRLVFADSFAVVNPDPTDEERELSATFRQMIAVGWARPESSFRRVFTTSLIPSATETQMRWVDDLQRMSTSAANAVAARDERERIDVRDDLAAIDVPTLVLHARGDRLAPFERGCEIAAGIPGAQMVPLDSDNHILLADEPAWPVFIDAVRRFIGAGRPVLTDPPSVALTGRELEILRHAAQGHDNQRIAAELVLSVRTVERHFQNIYAKLGVAGKSARAAAVAHVLRA